MNNASSEPASTYARKVLEQLLIDLSWHFSRLEGNRKSLLQLGDAVRSVVLENVPATKADRCR